MKTHIFIFSSILILCGSSLAVASECIGEGCNIEPINKPEISEPTILNTVQISDVVQEPVQSVEYIYAQPMKMREAKLLSIKPVPKDTRPPVWDGTNGSYNTKKYDKTVDWRDGVPIWDDSISNYKQKDFSDWFLEPMPEIYLREANNLNATINGQDDDLISLYNQNMKSAEATRARIEELLTPNKPSDNLWLSKDDTIIESTEKMIELPAPKPEYTAQDLTEVVTITFGKMDGCPFDTETECEIWRRKPIVIETVSPRSPKIRADKMNDFIRAARCNNEITANEAVSAPLLERYKMLMKSAQACCTDGMAYALKRAGATDGLVYKFLADDANFYGFGNRCLMTTDKELDTKYPNTATAAVAADVRNGCLCRGRQWFEAMLAPFKDVYKSMPEFKDYKFYYTYTDGLQREITVSVNTDVQNVLNQLSLCP